MGQPNPVSVNSSSKSLSFSHVSIIPSRQHSVTSRLCFTKFSSSSILRLKDCALDKNTEGRGGSRLLSSKQSLLALRLMPPLLPLFLCGNCRGWFGKGTRISVGMEDGISPLVEDRSDRKLPVDSELVALLEKRLHSRLTDTTNKRRDKHN